MSKTEEAMQSFADGLSAIGRVVEFQVPNTLHFHVSLNGNHSDRIDDLGDADRVAQRLSYLYPDERVWVKRCRGACK